MNNYYVILLPNGNNYITYQSCINHAIVEARILDKIKSLSPNSIFAPKTAESIKFHNFEMN